MQSTVQHLFMYVFCYKVHSFLKKKKLVYIVLHRELEYARGRHVAGIKLCRKVKRRWLPRSLINLK